MLEILMYATLALDIVFAVLMTIAVLVSINDKEEDGVVFLSIVLMLLLVLNSHIIWRMTKWFV